MLNTRLETNFFYSRRIGASSSVSVPGDYVDYPTASTILGAAKLTGRLSSGTSLGFLAAATDEEFARISNRGSSEILKSRVAPRASYGLARVQQELGSSGSTVSAMATMIHRDLKRGDPLAALLARNASIVMGDSILRFNGGEYELSSYFGISQIEGDAAAIDRIQRSSVNYLQRPDLDHAVYDPTRTLMDGYKWRSTLERTGGRHWLWQVRGERESPMFNTNDMGRIGAADGNGINGSIRYRETVPGTIFRNYSAGVQMNNEFNGSGDRQQGTTITVQPDGSRRVTDGASAFTLRNSDFNVRSFRSNIVLRWEWRPGSTLYLVWQQNRRAAESIGDRIGLGDMFRSLTAPGSNFFVVKMSFWLPVK